MLSTRDFIVENSNLYSGPRTRDCVITVIIRFIGGLSQEELFCLLLIWIQFSPRVVITITEFETTVIQYRNSRESPKLWTLFWTSSFPFVVQTNTCCIISYRYVFFFHQVIRSVRWQIELFLFKVELWICNFLFNVRSYSRMLLTQHSILYPVYSLGKELITY